MRRFCWLMGVLLLVTTAVVVLLEKSRSKSPERVCALWVPRFDYSDAADVERIVANACDAGFTDLFFQIRGNGSVYYRSELEPWAFDLSGMKVELLGTDPGWDPLQTAIDCARGRGLRIHAYMNVLPGWSGLREPPAAAGQLWTKHPDWFMVDSLGQKMLPTAGWYAFVNPVLPEVREHLCGIVKELCRYDVAGIHLDYIRYPYDYYSEARGRYPDASKAELRRHSDFSYDPVSLSELARRYGDDVTGDEIAAYRRESVTRTVAAMERTLRSVRPKAYLSASVMGNPVEGKYYAYQDSGRWVRDGLVDWAVQMNYATRSFESNLKAMRRTAGRSGFRQSVVVGVYCENPAEMVVSQVEMVRASGGRGLACFSYGLLFGDDHTPTQKGRIILSAIRSFVRDEKVF